MRHKYGKKWRKKKLHNLFFKPIKFTENFILFSYTLNCKLFALNDIWLSNETFHILLVDE